MKYKFSEKVDYLLKKSGRTKKSLYTYLGVSMQGFDSMMKTNSFSAIRLANISEFFETDISFFYENLLDATKKTDSENSLEEQPSDKVPEEATAFAQRFRLIKGRFMLNSRDLAQIAGVSDNSISRVLKGMTEAPDVRTLMAIGKKLNLSADWLLFGEGPMVKEEVAANNDSRKALEMRDEFIAQLLQERGKFEGATLIPTYDMTPEEVLYAYLEKGNTLAIELTGKPVYAQKPILKPRHGKVGGTPLTQAVNTVQTS